MITIGGRGSSLKRARPFFEGPETAIRMSATLFQGRANCMSSGINYAVLPLPVWPAMYACSSNIDLGISNGAHPDA